MNNNIFRDALWNIGECDLALDFFFNTPNHKKSIYDLSKNEIREIKKQIEFCDIEIFKNPKYKKHQEEYIKDRETIKKVVNEWCDTFRCFSLIIK